MDIFKESFEKFKNNSDVLNIINTIKTHDDFESAFTEGFCFDFALLLWRNIPGSRVIFIPNYNSDQGHYVLEKNGQYFDINGKFKIKDSYNQEEEDVTGYLDDLIQKRGN